MFCLRLSWTKAVTSQQHLMRGLGLEGLGSTHFFFWIFKIRKVRNLDSMY